MCFGAPKPPKPPPMPAPPPPPPAPISPPTPPPPAMAQAPQQTSLEGGRLSKGSADVQRRANRKKGTARLKKTAKTKPTQGGKLQTPAAGTGQGVNYGNTTGGTTGGASGLNIQKSK